MKKSFLKQWKASLAFAAVCGVLAMPVTANACPHDGFAAQSGEQMRHFGGKGMMRKMARYLELDESQISEIRAIFQAARDENTELRATMGSFKEEMKTLLAADSFDEEAFAALQAKYQDSFQQKGLLRAKTRHAVIQVFTDEQKEKWLAGRQEADSF
ncbi:Spy/CpxP family protein refolding chaperone [Thalassomonas viridans]|uniref:Spy/CpxP family protein refolding chaperone n=1 Tax=Thalassomonas viridans TaxID=137584 RepID=A0AAE9Z1R7_9GAMM|nr:Spy/CpxP family protein refolding chaperone [Thalassomonas viridans]WDE04983.1 Spy/CpxP family protein refolding chaperone [Thalassomonas viridans]